MLRRCGLPAVTSELLILTLCLVLVMITLSQILVVHHKFNGRYSPRVQTRPRPIRSSRTQHELRKLERSLAAVMRQNPPSIHQHSQMLRSQVYANRIADLIRASSDAASRAELTPSSTPRPPAPSLPALLHPLASSRAKVVNGSSESATSTDNGARAESLTVSSLQGQRNRGAGVTNDSHPRSFGQLCLEQPLGLIGASVAGNDTHEGVSLSDVIRDNPDIRLGGKWRPRHCIARHRVAIIIPYRDRLQHLVILLSHLLPILRRQELNFRIFVVEQYGTATFNKGRIMNAAFKEALKMYDFQCVTFHDVDLLPEDDRNMYSCPWQPRHMSVAIDEMDYKLKYDMLVGGVLIFNTEHFLRVNGYSNMYWGWGAEDDDMAYRILHVGLKITRPPSTIARYRMIKHQKRNPTSWHTRSKLLHTAVKRYKVDGLNSVPYKVVFIHEERLFTHIMVDIGRP